MRNDLSNTCTRLLYGNKRVPKKKYDTDNEAILACKQINSQRKQIHKVVAYKCNHCNGYHIGKTNKVLKKSYKKKLRKLLTFS